MRLALHLPAEPVDATADVALGRTALAEAAALGWTAALCAASREIADHRPDLVLALDPFVGKLTAHPTVAWLRTPPAGYRPDWSRLQRVVSHDGFLAATPEIAGFVRDVLAPTGRRALVANALPELAGLLAGIREEGGFLPVTGPRPTVDYIVRVGGRDEPYLERCLRSLLAQSYGPPGLVLVRHAPLPWLDGLLARLGGFRDVRIVDVPPGSLRSAALWAGIDAVRADWFGLLDDDDALHPNHVASLLRRAVGAREGLAYSGSVRVLEAPDTLGLSADPTRENRELYYLDPPRLDRLANWRMLIHSSAFLVRADLIPEIGPDPGLHVSEDAFMLRRLARVTGFLPSWRITSEMYWRETRDDNTAFDPAHREHALVRIADRERLDPRMAALRGAGGAADLEEGAQFWGNLAGARTPRWPPLSRPADFFGLPGDVPLYVHGTGEGGRIVGAELSKFGHLRIAGFLDSFKRGEFLGHPVLLPEDVPAADRGRAVVVVASQYVAEIGERLLPLGFRDLRDAGPYIRSYVDLRQGGGT